MSDETLGRWLRRLTVLGLLGLAGWGAAALNRLSRWVALADSPGVGPQSAANAELQEAWMIAVNWCLVSVFVTAASLSALVLLRNGRLLRRSDAARASSESLHVSA
jgi:hypothetical protein